MSNPVNLDAPAPEGCAAMTGSVTVVRCSCGAAQGYEDKPTGGTRKAAQKLIGLFRYFHEKHGTVTVESQSTQTLPTPATTSTDTTP